MRKVILLLVLVSLMLVGMGSVPSSAAPCSGMTCNGKDPHTLGCDSGATTLDGFMYGSYHYFEMRWSSLCRSVWTRISVDVHGSCTNSVFGQIRGYDLMNDRSLKINYGVQAPCAGKRAWTKMISYANYWVRTCEAVWFTASPNVCTKKH